MTRRISMRVVILAFAVTLAIVLPGLLTGGTALRSAGPPMTTSSLAFAANSAPAGAPHERAGLHPGAFGGAAVTAERPTVVGPGKIGETYDFQNHSLIPGNFTNISDLVSPTASAVDPSNGRIYVGGVSGFVGVVDAVNSTLVGSAPVFAGTNAIAIGATSATVYIADLFDSQVTVLDTHTMTTVGSFAAGPSPSALQYDSQNNELYVADGGSHNVSVVDPSTELVVRTIPTGVTPTAFAFDAALHRLFVANYNSANLTVINTSNDQVLATVAVGPYPLSLAFSPQTGEVFVGDSGVNNLTVVNATTNLVATTVTLAAGPNAVAMDPAVGFVYVAFESSDLIEVVNTRTDAVIGSISAIAGPAALVYDPVSGDIYATEYGTDNLTVINPGSNGILGSIRLGIEPDAVAYDLKTGAIGTTMFDAGVLVLVNGTTGASIATFPVGLHPTAVQYDSVNECFYVAGTGSNVVTVVNGTTLRIVSTISISQPINFAFVPAYDYIYVLSGLGTFVGNFPTTVKVINGASNQVVGTITVTAVDGAGGLAFDPFNGDLYIGTGGNVTVVGALNRTVIATIPLTGISYSIAVDPVTGTVFAGCVFGPLGASFDSNLTVINGTSNTISAVLSMSDPTVAMDYDSANGLLYIAQNGFQGNLTALDPKTDALMGTVGNFLFPFGLADTGPSGQVLAADQFTASLAIVTLSGLGTYAVNFTETGLAASVSWSVIANGATFSSTTRSIVASEPDGSVTFSVPPVQGYSAAPNSSSVTVGGSAVAVSIVFTALPPTYGVNFAETGLPSGLNWSVSLAGVAENSTQPTITFLVTNGTWQFAVASVGGYVRSPTGGSVHVFGKDLLVNVTFSPVTTGTTTPGGSVPSGLAGLLGYGAAAAGAAVGGAVGAAVALGRRRADVRPPPSEPMAPPAS
jgi:YVTN family beta-propeller protein